MIIRAKYTIVSLLYLLPILLSGITSHAHSIRRSLGRVEEESSPSPPLTEEKDVSLFQGFEEERCGVDFC